MFQFLSYIRKPVKREGAERHLFLTLLSFAASVTLTRLFLELTGYPQLGSSTLHIAHVLWGGLLLFVGALLPLILANRWVYTLGAVASGVGVGLFIDEVGKFITQSNDYFTPLAAPIIYAFFLLTVMVYVQVRRPSSRDARAELYRALDGLMEVLDHDLDEQEREALANRLRRVAENAKHPDLSRLAYDLLEFLASESLEIVPATPRWWDRRLAQFAVWEAKWFGRGRHKFALVIGLAALGVLSFYQLVLSVTAVVSPEALRQLALDLFTAEQIRSASDLTLFMVQLFLEGLLGALLLLTGFLMFTGRERLAIRIGVLALLIGLTAVNMLVFYFDQFTTIATALLEFGLLLGLVRYRDRYLRQRALKKGRQVVTPM